MTQSAAVDLFDPTATDDFLEQMLSSVPSSTWSDLPSLPNNDPLTFSYHHHHHHHHPNPNPNHPLLLPHPPSSLLPFPYSSSLPPLNSLGGDVGGENGMFKGGCIQREMGQLTTTPQLLQVGGGGKAKQRVRARRGQATDPHSIAERLRRERIAERMKALQELVPNANKSDKASMLDEIIDYVKFLQLQVKVLSMSRLGGAAAHHPTTTISKVEGGNGGEMGEEVEAAEKHVAKLLEQDMGTAMQYLQGKGLCLMPISLATAISSTARNNPLFDLTLSAPIDPPVVTAAAATTT